MGGTEIIAEEILPVYVYRICVEFRCRGGGSSKRGFARRPSDRREFMNAISATPKQDTSKVSL